MHQSNSGISGYSIFLRTGLVTMKISSLSPATASQVQYFISSLGSCNSWKTFSLAPPSSPIRHRHVVPHLVTRLHSLLPRRALHTSSPGQPRVQMHPPGRRQRTSTWLRALPDHGKEVSFLEERSIYFFYKMTLISSMLLH